jgi:hypothetical protein
MAKDLPQLKEYLDNKNVQWFIYNILKNESDKTSDGKINTGGYNQNAGNSSAFGAGQFVGSTRNNILKEYNIDAWSPDLEEQKLAIVALLDNVGQLDQIKKGDFSSQYDSKKGQWEAFHNKEGILDNKPNKWETEYTTLSDTAVYRPDESWAKIPEDIKVEKLNLFENKYKGLPTEIVNPIDSVLDPTAEALGLPTSEDVQNQLYNYNAIKEYEDLAASDPNIEVPLPNQNYDPNKSISEQYLKFNPELTEYFQGADNIPSVPINNQSAIEGASDPSISSSEGSATGDPASTGTGNTGRASGYEGMSAEELQGMYQSLLDADAAAAAGDGVYPLISQEFEPGPQAPQFLARRMQGDGSADSADANFVGPPEMSLSDPFNPNFVGPPEAPDEPINPEEPEDPVKRNLLAKLKGQDYMGMLSDIGGYAARMAPLGQALRDSNSYDRVRYPSISPSLPTAHAQRNEVNTAFTTAQNTARLQGKLDLGALSALATQQAQTIAGVEENVANTRIGILNQAEQYNNENAIRAMVDEAGNKGAAGTMKYQTLAAMSQMGQGSLREANMRRNDANVKAMFENVFGDEFGSYLKDKYSNA